MQKPNLKQVAEAKKLKHFYIGRKAPKGYKELTGGIHLGKGIWVLPVEKIKKAQKEGGR